MRNYISYMITTESKRIQLLLVRRRKRVRDGIVIKGWTRGLKDGRKEGRKGGERKDMDRKKGNCYV